MQVSCKTGCRNTRVYACCCVEITRTARFEFTCFTESCLPPYLETFILAVKNQPAIEEIGLWILEWATNRFDARPFNGLTQASDSRAFIYPRRALSRILSREVSTCCRGVGSNKGLVVAQYTMAADYHHYYVVVRFIRAYVGLER